MVTPYYHDLQTALSYISSLPDENECFEIKIRNELISFRDDNNQIQNLKMTNNGYRLEWLAKDLATDREEILNFDYYKFAHSFFV